MSNKFSRAVAGAQEWFNYRAPAFMPMYRT